MDLARGCLRNILPHAGQRAPRSRMEKHSCNAGNVTAAQFSATVAKEQLSRRMMGHFQVQSIPLAEPRAAGTAVDMG